MLKWAEKTSNRETRPSSLAGYLWKMKRKHKLHLPQWNKRWFSIEGKLLKWYAKEDSKKESGQISLVDITSINRFESSGGVYSFIIYSRERSLFLRAETLKNMEMWFRAIQMHADLARGGNGFTILSNQATPPKNRFNKQTSLVAQLEKATQALTALEKTASVDLRNDCRDIGISIEPDAESSRYHHEDEVKEDPFYSNSNDFLYQPPSSVTSRISSSTTTTTASRPPTSTQRPQYRHEDSLEDSTESLESIVPTVRKSASHYKSTQNGNFHGVKERYDEDRELSGKSGESSTGCRAWE